MTDRVDGIVEAMGERVGYVFDVRRLHPSDDAISSAVGVVLVGEDGRVMELEVGLSRLGLAQATIRVTDDSGATVQPMLFESPDGSVMLTA